MEGMEEEMKGALPGSNTLEVCQALMIEALQEYFDKRFKVKPFKVSSVAMKNSPGGYDTCFIVKTVSVEEKR